MPMKIKLKVKDTSDEEEHTPGATSAGAKKGKRSRQMVDDDGSSDSERAQPPTKRRSSSAAQSRSKKSSMECTESEPDANQDPEVDVEGTDSDAPTRAKPMDEDEDMADTASSRSASPARAPPRHREHSHRPERSSKSRLNRVQSDDDDGDGEDGRQQSEDEDAAGPPQRPPKPTTTTLPAHRPPTRQPAASSSSSTPTPTPNKPLRKVVSSKHKDKDGEKPGGSALSSIPAIPRRPKDASVAVKDTQDMDLLNKDVYNQLFNTSSTSKPVGKHVQNEAKQKEIEAKRAAARAALLEARNSSFDLQLPTDKVLAFENRLRKLHRWYAPSALGFTYHEELRLQRQGQQQCDGNSDPNQTTK